MSISKADRCTYFVRLRLDTIALHEDLAVARGTSVLATDQKSRDHWKQIANTLEEVLDTQIDQLAMLARYYPNEVEEWMVGLTGGGTYNVDKHLIVNGRHRRSKSM
jgi:hypothetical protein